MQRSRRPRRGPNRRPNTNNSTRTGRRPQRPNAGRVDLYPVTRTFDVFHNLKAGDTIGTGDLAKAYGVGNVYLLPNSADQPYLTTVLSQYKGLYEQYRIRRVRCFANCGKNFTNDIRIQTQIASRVDIDNLPVLSSPSSLGALMGSSNVKISTLRENKPLKLADWNPRMKLTNSSSDNRIFTANQQWVAIADINHHDWVGATIAFITPDNGYTPANAPNLTIRVRLDVQFRGRTIAPTAFATTSMNLPSATTLRDPIYENSLSEHLLNGKPFEVDIKEDSDDSLYGPPTHILLPDSSVKLLSEEKHKGTSI